MFQKAAAEAARLEPGELAAAASERVEELRVVPLGRLAEALPGSAALAVRVLAEAPAGRVQVGPVEARV